MTMKWRLTHLALAIATLFVGCGRMHKEPFEKAPLARGEIQVVRLSEKSNLYIERVRFWSDEMNEPRFFLALIPKSPGPSSTSPPQASVNEKSGASSKSEKQGSSSNKEVRETPAAPFRPSEVFILNHGWTDRPEYLLKYLHVDTVYNDMLGRGKVRPAIIIIPDVRFANFFRESSDLSPFHNYLTLVAEEVAGTASKQYGIPFDRERWTIGGFSFGGYLSLDVGRRYPGRFSAVSVVSGFADSDWTYWPSTPPPPGRLDAQGRGKQTIVVPGPIPRLFLACGTDDRLFRAMLHLHEKLTALGISHRWWTGPGGHTWKTWSAVLPVMLEFTLGNSEATASSP
ncbi:MAG TPA: alpha/beta hydrolase-fold protein [Candidatus Sulfotelmatobacter sp.]|nr:alpha/beta hydrolase-fold protein [Candidatus Sulfotelmatobacter sp.]